MSLNTTINKIIELSDISLTEDSSKKECNNQQYELELLHFFELENKTSTGLHDTRFNEYNFFNDNTDNPELIADKYSNNKILEIHNDYVENYSTPGLQGLELFSISRYKAIGSNKKLFSSAVFSMLNNYISNFFLPNESMNFKVYSIMSNLDYYNIDGSKAGFKEFFTELYNSKKLKDITINARQDESEIDTRFGILSALGGNKKKEKGEEQKNNEEILKKYSTGIFHFAKFFDDIKELKEVYSRLLEIEANNDMFGTYQVGPLIRAGWIASKDDVYNFLDSGLGNEKNEYNNNFFAFYIENKNKWDLELYNKVLGVDGFSEYIAKTGFSINELELFMDDNNSDYKLFCEYLSKRHKNYLDNNNELSYLSDVNKLHIILKYDYRFLLKDIFKFIETEELYLHNITYKVSIELKKYEFDIFTLNKFIKDNLSQLQSIGTYFEIFRNQSKESLVEYLSLSSNEKKIIIDSENDFYQKGLEKYTNLIAYSRFAEETRLDYLEYTKIFITQAQKDYFSIDWYLGISDEEKVFIKQAIKHLKDSIIKYDIIPYNCKKSSYLVDMISNNSKSEVIEIINLEAEIPKLKDIFTKRYSAHIILKGTSNLSKNETNIINKFLTDYIVNTGDNFSLDKEKLEKINDDYFDNIDKYLEGVLVDMKEYNQDNTKTYILIQEYLKFDIDRTNLYEELAILILLLRHLKVKKLKNIVSKIIINEIFIKSPHLFEFFTESIADKLELSKYIGVIGELIDEIDLYSKEIKKNINGSGIDYGVFLTEKDKNKIYKTGIGINIQKDSFDMVYKNLNFQNLEEKLNGIKNDRYIENSEEINIYGVKNELDFAFSNNTCVAKYRSELFNEDFIPLRITDKLNENLLGYIWLKESFIQGVGNVLVLTDIQPDIKYRGHYNAEDYFRKIISILDIYRIQGGYDKLVMTTVSGAQSNDSMLAKVMRKDIKNKNKLVLHKQVFMPENSTYDISEVVEIN